MILLRGIEVGGTGCLWEGLAAMKLLRRPSGGQVRENRRTRRGFEAQFYGIIGKIYADCYTKFCD